MPAWICFAKQARAREYALLSAPADNELLQPVSAGALSNAYSRARACFAKQIQAGTSWRDVK